MSENHVVSIKSYLAVFFSLIVLTFVTVWVAYMDFGTLNTLVAVGIAVFKTLLVVSIFMHLRWSPKLLWLIAASGGLFFLIMISLIMGDYGSRSMQQRAKDWVIAPTLLSTAAAPSAPAEHAAPSAHAP